jgi:hypothetical protein
MGGDVAGGSSKVQLMPFRDVNIRRAGLMAQASGTTPTKSTAMVAIGISDE